MGAIKQINAKTHATKKEKPTMKVWVVIVVMVLLIAIEALGFVLFWQYYYKDVAYTDFLIAEQAGQAQVYKASHDIQPGEAIDGSVELVTIPAGLIVSDGLNSSSELGALRANRFIPANSIVTSENTYDPQVDTVVDDTTRTRRIDYIETPGIEQGDFIDIRLSVYLEDSTTHKEYVVCSKKEVLYKDDAGNIELNLSEQDMANLNGAVIDSVDANQNANIYVVKYVEPGTQPKAIVNYEGGTVAYTEEQMEAYREALKEQNEAKHDVDTEESVDNSDTNTDTTSNLNGAVDRAEEYANEQIGGN